MTLALPSLSPRNREDSEGCMSPTFRVPTEQERTTVATQPSSRQDRRHRTCAEVHPLALHQILLHAVHKEIALLRPSDGHLPLNNATGHNGVLGNFAHPYAPARPYTPWCAPVCPAPSLEACAGPACSVPVRARVCPVRPCMPIAPALSPDRPVFMALEPINPKLGFESSGPHLP